MAQYFFDRCISVAATYVNGNDKKGITEGGLAFWAEQITEPSLSFTSETEEIMDARNNVVAVLQNGRGATFGASNAFFNTSILAAQVGAQVENSQGGDTITKYEMVEVGSDKKIKISYTPVDGCAVYDLESDGSFKSAKASDVVYNGGKFGKMVPGEKEEDPATFVEGNFEENAKYLVVYEITAPTGERITAMADAENELLDVTAEVLLKDLCDQKIHYAFLFMRGKLSGEAEWGMARDGQHAFEITAMPDYCGSRKLVDIVIVKDTDLA